MILTVSVGVIHSLSEIAVEVIEGIFETYELMLKFH